MAKKGKPAFSKIIILCAFFLIVLGVSINYIYGNKEPVIITLPAAEKLVIWTVTPSQSYPNVTCLIENTAGIDVEINCIILKNVAGEIIQTVTIAEKTIPQYELRTLTTTFDATNLVVGKKYTITLVSKAGNQFVSPSFIVG